MSYKSGTELKGDDEDLNRTSQDLKYIYIHIYYLLSYIKCPLERHVVKTSKHFFMFQELIVNQLSLESHRVIRTVEVRGRQD